MDLEERHQIEEYIPGTRLKALYFAVVVGLIVTGFLAATYYGWQASSLTLGWFWIVSLILAAAALPLLVQRLSLQLFDVRPSRITWGGKPFLTYWWSTEGHKFTRLQFVITYGMPALLMCVMTTLYVILFPFAAPLIGFIFAGYAGNFWFSIIAFRKPSGTLVEEFDRGIRFHELAVQ